MCVCLGNAEEIRANIVRGGGAEYDIILISWCQEYLRNGTEKGGVVVSITTASTLARVSGHHVDTWTPKS